MSTKKTREALAMLGVVAGGSLLMRQAVHDALEEVEAIERVCQGAYRNDVNHDLLKSDSGVELGLMVESIAKDAP
jgi:hypothetical protein